MIHKNRSLRSTLLAALLCGSASLSMYAQGPGGPPPGGGGPGGRHHGPPPSPLFDALDTNHDGTISAEEISNASTSLKSLLKDGATQLRREDLRPTAPPPRGEGEDSFAPDAEGQHPHPKGVRLHQPPPRPEDQADEVKPGPQSDRPDSGPRHHGPPPSPLFEAIDTNRDGIISAEEMAKAPTSLKSLLKEGATQLRREDLRPARPPQGEEN